MEGSIVPCQTKSSTVRKQTHFKFPVNAVKVSHKNNMYVCTVTLFLQSDICDNKVVPVHTTKAYG